MSSSSTNSIFSGASRYAGDFQQSISRAVAIASLPKAQMENAKSTLSSQSTALSAVNAKFAALQSALAGVASTLETYNSSSSDATVASAGVSSGALEGTYEIEVVDIGSYTSSMSKDGLAAVTNPSTQNISAASTFTLTVAGEEFEITPKGQTLSELASAINASGAAVEATIVNMGPTSAPDYRLSLRGTDLGEVSIQLNDGSGDLLDTLSTGSLASYRVNGQPAGPITSDSRTVSVAPGLSLTMLKAGSTEVRVSHSVASVSSALSNLASAYNAAVDELDKHRGTDAGALEGFSLLRTLSDSLRLLSGYETGGGGLGSLTSLGLIFSDDGKLSLDTSVFSSATDGQFEALSEFLGSASTGGFLKHASDLMDGLKNSTDGIITSELDSLQAQMKWQDARIAEEQDRIDQIEENLIARMAAADSMIAALEQQVRYMTGLFEAMRGLREKV
ncbi:MAG TPA: flagellar filament capping protein FliD [Bryobacteraceae bacterium]|nr:flagellar filament capping protein FliD [Bryobacteraceae bacterium]